MTRGRLFSLCALQAPVRDGWSNGRPYQRPNAHNEQPTTSSPQSKAKAQMEDEQLLMQAQPASSSLTAFVSLPAHQQHQLTPALSFPASQEPSNAHLPQPPLLSLSTQQPQQQQRENDSNAAHAALKHDQRQQRQDDSDEEEKETVKDKEKQKKEKKVVRYRECRKNHAASIGGYAIDGCGEFIALRRPSFSCAGDDNDRSERKEGAGGSEMLRCAACDCHRSFHRREEVFERSSTVVASHHCLHTQP